MRGDPSAKLRAICAALTIAVGAVAAPRPAAAFPTLREGLFGRPSETNPPVGRYVSEDGETFILDRTHGYALLKFENDPEVWVLQAQPAPRGDVIYKNDLGEPMLRATRLGGLTVFTEGRPGGSAAALDGDSQPLRLPTLGPQALLDRLAQASAKASHSARRLIPFDAEATPESSALMADAAMVASEALVRMARRKEPHGALSRIKQVRLVEGRRSVVEIRKGVMQITVCPPDGVAGRPSSERIVTAMASR